MSSPSPARSFETPLFRYAPRFASVVVGGQRAEMSYVEAGRAGAPLVVLLHGNPTWSFLYRDVIPHIEGTCRVVAPDFLGFGRSDKLDRAEDYTLEHHVAALGQLLDGLELERVTLVVHDWAGPVGLSWAVDHPERVARLVIMNTWAFAPEEHNRVPQPLKTFRQRPMGELLVLGLNGFVNVVLPLGTVHRRHMLGDVMRAYRAPFPTWRSRWPVLAFPRDIPLSKADRSFERMRRTDEGLRGLDQPVLILWGERDPVFPPRVIRKFRERLRNVVDEVRFADASHFLQEDRPADIGQRIAAFAAG
jgi:haloalkane dehalogenase